MYIRTYVLHPPDLSTISLITATSSVHLWSLPPSRPSEGLDGGGDQPAMTEEKVQVIVSATANCAMEVSLVVLDILDLFGNSFKVGRLSFPWTWQSVTLVFSSFCMCVFVLGILHRLEGSNHI